jgi:flagellar biosynthetic protein FliR
MPTPAHLTTFLLVLARVAGLVIAAPMFGHLLVPVRVRAGLAAVIALALTPAIAAASTAPEFDSVWTLAGALVVESALGALIGFVAQLVFAGVQLGGQMSGMQVGFGMVNLVDPQSHSQVTIVAEWQSLFTLLVFLVLDIHHLLFAALLQTFEVAPPGQLAIAAPGLRAAVGLAATIFSLGVRVTAPVLVALLLSNATLGLLARAVPQLNIMVVGFPVNVGVGLIVLGAMMPFLYRLLAQRFGELEPTLGTLVRGLAHG